jgi:quercetin dioxygenase-like cupin family protein
MMETNIPSERKNRMSSLDRPVSGKPLHFQLGDGNRSNLLDEALLAKSGRSARTLIKEGPLRVTLVGLAAGGALQEHRAEGPITIYVISGQIQIRAGDDEWTLEEGDLLSLAAGLPHSAGSVDGGVFLLTVARSAQL